MKCPICIGAAGGCHCGAVRLMNAERTERVRRGNHISSVGSDFKRGLEYLSRNLAFEDSYIRKCILDNMQVQLNLLRDSLEVDKP